VKSINFVILGDFQIAIELGKKGTTTDLSIFDRNLEDVIYTWTAPITYPDKIQSLMQAINIAEHAILNVTKIDKNLGEQIVALDAVRFTSGFILHSYEVDDIKNINKSYYNLKLQISRQYPAIKTRNEYTCTKKLRWTMHNSNRSCF
jgi:selenocysteine-specific translation elongation factor